MKLNLGARIRSREASFAGGSAITVILNVIALAPTSLASILLARVLGPRDAGYLFLFVTGTTMIGMFCDLVGIQYSSPYLLASGRENARMSTVRSSVLLYGAVLGLVIGWTFGWFSPVRSIAFKGLDDAHWSLLIALNIAGGALTMQIKGLFWGRKQFFLLGMVAVVRSVGYAAPALYMAYGLDVRDVAKIAAINVVATWSAIIVFIGFLASRGLGRPSLGYLRQCLRIGGRARTVSLMNFLHTRVDQWLVNLALGPTALGLYGVAVNLAEVLTQIPSMVGQVLLPFVAVDASEQQRTQRRARVIMLAVAGVAVLVGVSAPVVVQALYGPAFERSAVLIIALLPATVFMSGVLILNNHVSALGYPRMQQIVATLAVLANIGLNLLLLPTVGVVGASISSSVSYAVWFAALTRYVRHRTAQPPETPDAVSRSTSAHSLQPIPRQMP